MQKASLSSFSARSYGNPVRSLRRSPSWPGSPVGGGQAGPGARQRRSLTGAGARAGGGAAISPAPSAIEQMAGDTVGLMEALGIDRAISPEGVWEA